MGFVGSLGGVYVCVCVLRGHCATCCVVLLHGVFVCEHVCAAIVSLRGGLQTFYCGILAALQRGVLAVIQ